MLATLTGLVRTTDPEPAPQADRPAMAALREAQARVAQLDAEGDRDRAEAAALRGVLDRRTALRAQRAQLRDRPDALARDVADVGRALAEIDAEADDARVRIDALEARLARGSRRMSEIGARLPVLELAAVAERLHELAAAFAPVKAEAQRSLVEAVALATRMLELQRRTRTFTHASALALNDFRLPRPFDLGVDERTPAVRDAVRRLVSEMAAPRG